MRKRTGDTGAREKVLSPAVADLAASYTAMKDAPEPPEPTITLSEGELRKFVGVYESTATSNNVIVVLKDNALEATAGGRTGVPSA